MSILPAIPDALRPVFRMVLSHVNGPSSAFKDAPGDRKLRKVVILLHGITGPRWQYVSLAEELAEHGFVVVMPEHPFDTSCTVLPDGNVLYALGRPPMDGEFGLPYDVWKSHLRQRVVDTKDVVVPFLSDSKWEKDWKLSLDLEAGISVVGSVSL